MKNQLKKITAAALLICSFYYVSAQVPPPANVRPAAAGAPGLLPPPPVNGALGMNLRGPQPLPQEALQSLTSVTGKVTAYLTNDNYAYNGLTLQENSATVTVRFPEHLAQQLMQAAKKGESLTVRGFNATGPDGVNAFQLVNAVAGSVKITDAPPVPPVQPVAVESKSYSGNISDFKHDLQGIISGLTLDNKIVIALPPPAAAQLQSLLKTGDKIEISGFKDTPPAGVVLAAGAPELIHPQTITLNGQTYLIR